jgi:hypothetical protein
LHERLVRFYEERSDGGPYLVVDTWATLDLEPFGFKRQMKLPVHGQSARWTSRVAYAEGRPVGTSVGYLSDGVVGVHLVGVVPAM